MERIAYEKPETEIIVFECDDVITTSGGQIIETPEIQL